MRNKNSVGRSYGQNQSSKTEIPNDDNAYATVTPSKKCGWADANGNMLKWRDTKE